MYVEIERIECVEKECVFVCREKERERDCVCVCVERKRESVCIEKER